MPYRNKRKWLQENQIYHAYNRGFEKRLIFKDKYDYEYFLDLVNHRVLYKENHINIEAFCLMPNHFHFLIHQYEKYGMPTFIQVVSSEYARYYNWKYKREGQLWQGTYKAVLIKDAQHFSTILNYIHRNPLDVTEYIEKYPYSSYCHYLGRFNFNFIKKVRP